MFISRDDFGKWRAQKLVLIEFVTEQVRDLVMFQAAIDKYFEDRSGASLKMQKASGPLDEHSEQTLIEKLARLRDIESAANSCVCVAAVSTIQNAFIEATSFADIRFVDSSMGGDPKPMFDTKKRKGPPIDIGSIGQGKHWYSTWQEIRQRANCFKHSNGKWDRTASNILKKNVGSEILWNDFSYADHYTDLISFVKDLCESITKLLQTKRK